MAFQKAVGRTPVDVGKIEVWMTTDPSAIPSQTIWYRVQVIFSDGTSEDRTGDLAPELSGAQITQQVGFMAAMRTKAITGFIG